MLSTCDSICAPTISQNKGSLASTKTGFWTIILSCTSAPEKFWKNSDFYWNPYLLRNKTESDKVRNKTELIKSK